ncbi:stalk domain-containing protein [Pelotomaculum propionicicum]|uniref:stalk domain-containing protein n=1 Tax=Pelotomaculum propionicicum TaxID=258475 RepID=UPI003B826F5A
MFKKVLLILLGIVIGVFLLGAVSLYAAQSIQLIVNGKVIQSDVPPQIIDGRTMIPARYLAEALGATVTWDASRNAVIVTSKDQYAAPVNNNTKGTDLTSLDYAGTNNPIYLKIDVWKQGWVFPDNQFKIAGKYYNKGIGFQGVYSDANIVYNLNSSYSKISGYFGMADGNDRETKAIVYGDGNMIYESPIIKAGEVPYFVDLNVAGVNQLKIVFIHYGKEGFGGIDPIFANPKLYK